MKFFFVFSTRGYCAMGNKSSLCYTVNENQQCLLWVHFLFCQKHIQSHLTSMWMHDHVTSCIWLSSTVSMLVSSFDNFSQVPKWNMGDSKRTYMEVVASQAFLVFELDHCF